MKNKWNQAALALYIRTAVSAREFAGAAKSKLKEKDGSFFTENALVIVITVVLAAIVITALVALYKDKIFPQLGNKVDDFFAIS